MNTEGNNQYLVENIAPEPVGNRFLKHNQPILNDSPKPMRANRAHMIAKGQNVIRLLFKLQVIHTHVHIVRFVINEQFVYI